MTPTLDSVIALSKRRGFIFPTSEVYGGLANAYDYGPLGVELKRKIINLWWDRFVTKRDDMVGLDSQIVLRPETWIASGHVGGFSDPLVEDKVTHDRFRVDHLIETYLTAHPEIKDVVVANMSLEDMTNFISQHNLKSPKGNELTPPKNFNLLFETSLGVVEGDKSKVYLRGETAQGIFTNFKQVADSTRVQLPFGIGQIGKSFRNEVTQGQFIFRTFEFEQAEIEYFFDPAKSDWHQLLEDWKQQMWDFVTQDLGINPDKLRWRRHDDKERSFYSQDTYDLEYEFPFGFKELWGIAYRTDYDLRQQANHSGKELYIADPNTQAKIVPHVIEPALGINRALLMVLCQAIQTDSEHNRTFLSLTPKLAPYTVAVFPLLKNKPELVDKARSVYNSLRSQLSVVWDDRGNIGKRYFYQDEIGTPYCITIDFQSLDDNTVTLRHRDTAVQERISIPDIQSYLHDKFI